MGRGQLGCEEFILPKLVVDVRKAPGWRSGYPMTLTQTLQSARGIEIGHIFQLGIKYSKAMGATYTSEAGEEVPLRNGAATAWGCLRLAQAAVEQSYDKNGIIWPVAIAPYHANCDRSEYVPTNSQVKTATTLL